MRNIKHYTLPIVNGADFIALPANEARQAIIFTNGSQSGANVICWMTFGEAAGLRYGIEFPNGTQPFVLTRELLGDIITLPVHLYYIQMEIATITEVSGE